MNLYMKIQEERENAQIEQMIETSRRYGASDKDILDNLISKFNLSKEDATDRMLEFTQDSHAIKEEIEDLTRAFNGKYAEALRRLAQYSDTDLP